MIKSYEEWLVGCVFRENLSDQECLVPNMPVTDHQPAVVNQRTTDQSAAVRIDQPVVNHRRRSGEGMSSHYPSTKKITKTKYVLLYGPEALSFLIMQVTI